MTSAVALPDGRVVFAVRTPGEDGVTSLLIGTPQP